MKAETGDSRCKPNTQHTEHNAHNTQHSQVRVTPAVLFSQSQLAVTQLTAAQSHSWVDDSRKQTISLDVS